MNTMTAMGKRIRERIIARLGTIVGVSVLMVLILISIAGYYGEWQWTGLPAIGDRGPKSLWDWLDLLIIPAVLGFGALWFRKAEANAERQSAEANARLERDLQDQRAQEAALEAYLDRMSTLLLDKDLAVSKPGSSVQDLARTRTITVLRRLGADRRNHVLRFLRDAQLLGKVKNSGNGTEDTKETVAAQTEKKTIALLRGAMLAQIELHGADLHGVDLYKTVLRGAVLRGADLSRTDLSGADLNGADLSGADLSGADLSVAHLSGADLKGVDLSGANLYHAELNEANLNEANLNGADLSGANLCHAELNNAELVGANLSWADLKGGDLGGANLNGADLNGTDLSGANLTGADLKRADLKWANLKGADLSDVSRLTCDQLMMAKYWKSCIRHTDLACGAPIPEPAEERRAPSESDTEIEKP